MRPHTRLADAAFVVILMKASTTIHAKPTERPEERTSSSQRRALAW